ncbi:elongin-A-like isoform X2 [Liolophura sinensis]|uniref:elongin-A-like isoform X2 n=1 Tax=Liolophura sinensis TaxID=3198878 RepID=UPI0031587011
MADTEQHLLRYKSHLEKNPNEDRLMQILTKLAKLPVTVELLQSTGIGKTVNGFRKQEGNIGITAKNLVKNWKSLVAEQANQETAYEHRPPDQTNHRQVNNQAEIHEKQSRHRSHNGREHHSQSASSSHHHDAPKSSKGRRETSDSGNLGQRSEGRGEKFKHDDGKEKHRDHRSHHAQKQELSESPEQLSSSPVDNNSSGEEEDLADLPSHDQMNDGDAESDEDEESLHNHRASDVTDSKKSSAKDSHRSHKEHGARKSSSKVSRRSHEEKLASTSHGDASRKSSSKFDSSKGHNGPHKSSASSTKERTSDSQSRTSCSKSSERRTPKDETFACLFSPDDVLTLPTEKRQQSRLGEDGSLCGDDEGVDMDDFAEEPGCDMSETRKAVKRPAESGLHENHRKIAKKESSAVKVQNEDENPGMSFEDLLSYDQALVKKALKKKKEKESCGVGKKSRASHKPKEASSTPHSDKNSSDLSKKHSSHSSSEKSHSHSSKSHSSKDKSHSHSSCGNSHSHSSSDKSQSHSSSGKSKSHSSKSRSSSGKSDPKSSSKKQSSKDKHSSKYCTDKHSSSSKGHGDKHDKQGSPTRGDNSSSPTANLNVPAPPKQEIRLTDADILGYLPETQAYYKPLRFHGMEDQRGKHETNSVDPMLIGSKSYSRTQVYSGRKNTGMTDMVSLYELCMRVLMDNIDGLDYVGGVPYYILKPVLEKCSAEQLYRLEDYNPQFLGETDELWVILCNRDFRGAKPDEMESWRELYLRRYDEREAKLQKLKANIAASEEARKAPVRLTKLAYVDTVAKPPRDVRRKQMKYGTATVDMSPSGSKPNPAGYQRSSLKSRLAMDTAPVAPRRVMKAPAPMMQKTMKMIKKLQRR